jgi:hypothetical protein
LKRAVSTDEVNWECVVKVANEYMVITALLTGLVGKGLLDPTPKDLQEYLLELHRLNRERNEKIKAQATRLVKRLNDVGVEPVLLKGAALLLADQSFDLGSRIMTDIDLLIRHEDVKSAVDGLLVYGYEPGVDEPEVFEFAHHFPPLIHPSELVPIELHVELLSPMELQVLTGSHTCADSSVINEKGLTYRLLSPSDSILYTVLHTEIHHRGWKSGALPLKEMHDFANLTVRYDDKVDWFLILGRMKDHGVEDALRSYLYAASRLFHTPIPPAIVPTRSDRLHFRRRILQVRFKSLMFVADRISEFMWLFSAQRIETRFGRSNTWADLAKRRVQYILHLIRKYVTGNKRNRLVNLLIGKKE